MRRKSEITEITPEGIKEFKRLVRFRRWGWLIIPALIFLSAILLNLVFPNWKYMKNFVDGIFEPKIAVELIFELLALGFLVFWFEGAKEEENKWELHKNIYRECLVSVLSFSTSISHALDAQDKEQVPGLLILICDQATESYGLLNRIPNNRTIREHLMYEFEYSFNNFYDDFNRLKVSCLGFAAGNEEFTEEKLRDDIAYVYSTIRMVLKLQME